MSTKIHQHTHVSSHRQVDVLVDEGLPGEIIPSEPVSVAAVVSRSHTETATPVSSFLWGPWTKPVVHFERSDDGRTPRFTRAQWETLKREVDEAFSLFEATWPLAHDEPSQGGEP